MKKISILLSFFLLCCGTFIMAQDFCPNNLFVNGDLENGTPTCGDQDINQAVGFSRIWQTNSFADYYPPTCTHSSLTQPLPSTGNWAGFWVYSRPDTDVTYREGIFNSLGTTLGPGNYSFTFDVACLTGYGTAELAVYGIYNPSNTPSNNNPTGNHNPLNEGFFGAANTYELGTILLDGTCNANKTNYTFNINTSSFSSYNGITHIMLTHSNQIIQPADGGGLRYVAVDNFCLNLEDPTLPEDCAEITQDTVTCNVDGTYTYTFDIVNNSPNVVTSIEIYDSPANGAPIQLIRPVSVPANGTYGPVTLTIPANAAPTYCFEVSLYSDNGDGEDALCCHIKHCIDLPDCDPCDDVWVDNPTALPDGDCCYSVDLYNSFGSGVFTKVTSRILTPGVTFKNPVAGGTWTVTPSGNDLIWTNGTHIPQGVYSSEVNFCLDNITHVSQMPQVVVFDWEAQLPDGTVEICSDTLTFNCEPCVLVERDTLTCNDDGTFQFNLDMINTSGHTIDRIRYEIMQPTTGVCLENTASPIIQRPIGPINTGNPFSESLVINDCGYGLSPGDVIKVKVIVFDSTDPEWCCHLELELVVDCPVDKPCPQVQDYLADCLGDIDGDGQPEYQLQLYISNGFGNVFVSSPCGNITPGSVAINGTGGFYSFTLDNTGACSPFFPLEFYVLDANGGICYEDKWETRLPECPMDCYCDDLKGDVNAGFTFAFNCPEGTFTPQALTPCDKVSWTLNGKNIGDTIGNDGLKVQFGGPGKYEVCMYVTRSDDNGVLCEDRYCETVVIDQWCPGVPDPNGGIGATGDFASSYPNPATESLRIRLQGDDVPGQVSVSILDLSGQRAQYNNDLLVENSEVQLSVNSIQNGMYLVRIEGANGFSAQTKFVKLKE